MYTVQFENKLLYETDFLCAIKTKILNAFYNNMSNGWKKLFIRISHNVIFMHIKKRNVVVIIYICTYKI